MADRNASKKRRQTQNRAQREMQANRSAAASGEPTPRASGKDSASAKPQSAWRSRLNANRERYAASGNAKDARATSSSSKRANARPSDRQTAAQKAAETARAPEGTAVRSVFAARTTSSGSQPSGRPARTAAGVMLATGVADRATGPVAIPVKPSKRHTPKTATTQTARHTKTGNDATDTEELVDVDDERDDLTAASAESDTDVEIDDEYEDDELDQEDDEYDDDLDDGELDDDLDEDDELDQEEDDELDDDLDEDDEESEDSDTPASSPSKRTQRLAQDAKPLSPFMERIYGREPGGRWVLMSLLMVIVASIVVATTPVVPEQVKLPNGDLKATGKVLSIWHFGLMRGLVYLLPPIMAVGIAILVARPPERRRSWNRGLFALVLVTLLGGGIYIYAVAIACMAWGCWQARKAALDAVGGDVAALRQQSRSRRGRHADADDDDGANKPAQPPRPMRRTNASKGRS